MNCYGVELGCSVFISAIQFCSFSLLVKGERGEREREEEGEGGEGEGGRGRQADSLTAKNSTPFARPSSQNMHGLGDGDWIWPSERSKESSIPSFSIATPAGLAYDCEPLSESHTLS